MIPPSWRICESCDGKQDVERVDGKYQCFECRCKPMQKEKPVYRYIAIAILLVGCGGEFHEGCKLEAYGEPVGLDVGGYRSIRASSCIVLTEAGGDACEPVTCIDVVGAESRTGPGCVDSLPCYPVTVRFPLGGMCGSDGHVYAGGEETPESVTFGLDFSAEPCP